MDTSVALSDGRRRRRKHSAEFKAHVVAACSKPGVSSASVAMANGINANLVRRWVKDAEGEHDVEAVMAPKAVKPPAAKFVPLPLPSPAPVSDVRIELQRGATKVVVSWPATAASECAAWLRELLR
jgi:transposase